MEVLLSSVVFENSGNSDDLEMRIGFRYDHHAYRVLRREKTLKLPSVERGRPRLVVNEAF